MDLLKDIAEGLRGRDETRRDERTRATSSSGRDSDRPRSAGDAADRSGANESADRDPRVGSDDARDDQHVCSFCQSEFDATRDSCPECSAEIVFRGQR